MPEHIHAKFSLFSEDKIDSRSAPFKREESIIQDYTLTIRFFAKTTDKRDYPGLCSSKNLYSLKILSDPLVNHWDF